MAQRKRPRTPVQGRDFSDRLNRLLEERGWTISDLQRATGARWQTCKEWTRGKVPRPKYQYMLAEAFGVTLDELMGVAAGQDPPFDAWRPFMATPEGQSLSAEERRALQSMYWPEGHEPTVGLYLEMLRLLRSSRRA